MITFQLWVGVVFLLGAGLLGVWNCRHHWQGRHFLELHGDGFERGLASYVRLLRAAVSGTAAVLCFIAGAWLIRYILMM